jgi:hypothetical protein
MDGIKVGNEPSEPSDEHNLMSRAERGIFLLVAREQWAILLVHEPSRAEQRPNPAGS